MHFTADDPKGLKTEQINFLIDVVDSDGDGTVGRSEFVERYAREDAVIQAGLRDHWHKLLQIFHAENKKGLKKKGTPSIKPLVQFSAACPLFARDTIADIPNGEIRIHTGR